MNLFTGGLIDEWDNEFTLPILFYQQFKKPSVILNDIRKIAKKGKVAKKSLKIFQN